MFFRGLGLVVAKVLGLILAGALDLGVPDLVTDERDNLRTCGGHPFSLGRSVVDHLVPSREPQLIPGGDQHRLTDQLARQDRLINLPGSLGSEPPVSRPAEDNQGA